MNDEMVMRSIYLGLTEDSRLRQIAFEVGLNKSILIRAAIADGLSRWKDASKADILADVEASKNLSFDDDDFPVVTLVIGQESGTAEDHDHSGEAQLAHIGAASG